MKVLLFDLDDTLYRELDFVESGFRTVAQYFADRHGLATDALFRDMMDLLEREGRGRIFESVLKRHGIYSETNSCLAVGLYRGCRPALRMDPEVRNQIEEWRRRGLKTGLITDGMASVQRNKIAALQLEPLMDVIICTDELGAGCAKPSIRPFEVALELSRCSPREAMYVGDNDAKDFAGANKLGIMTVRTLQYRAEQPAGIPQGFAAQVAIAHLKEINGVLEASRSYG